ncbi:MAG: hypothetical protein ACYC5O_20215, partial [Anaerolineae bacterium]
MRRHSGAALVLGLYLLLGTVYSVIAPVFESSDEIWHYPFVAHLAGGGGLPVQQAGVETLWHQEGSQPPLYYMLAAAATAWIDTSDLQVVRRLNPHSVIGIPLAADNKNMVLHTANERFPWRGTVLAVHVVRLLSVLLGAVTVLCTYALALMLFPGRRRLAVAAMCFTAFLPMFLFISASV